MLYHYALLPDIFRPELLAKSPNSCTTIKQLLRGLCKNGLIADLHNNAWRQTLQEILSKEEKWDDKLQQVRKDIQFILVELDKRHRFVTCAPCESGAPRCHEDWLDAAIDVDKNNRLHGIILTQALLDQYGLPHEAFMQLSTALDFPQWLNRPRSATISMCLPDYKTALIPVLQYAKTLDLIDPYMHPYKDSPNSSQARYLDVVQMCAGLLGKGCIQSGMRRITVHTSDLRTDESVNDRLNDWRDALLPLVTPNLRFKVYLWPKYDAEGRFHDRFILTDQCCLSVPAGLDIRRGTTPWSLLDEPVRREQLRKVSAVYNSLGKIEVPK